MPAGVSYKCLIDSCHSWEYLVLSDGSIAYMSPSSKRITGYSPDDFLTNPQLLMDMVHPEDKQLVESHLAYLDDSHSACHTEFRIKHADGSTRYVRHNCVPIARPSGEHIGRRVTNIDITEQKAAQRALVSREKDLELLLSTSNEGFFYMTIDEPVWWSDAIDKDTVLEYVFDHQRISKINQSMLDQYGAEKEEFVGLTVRQLFAHDVQYGKSVWRRFFDQGYLALETREQKLDGTPMWVEGEYFCLYDEQGRITGHFGIQRDVTQTKEFTQKLTHLNQRLSEEIDKARAVHHHLLPTNLPSLAGLDIEAFYRPALDIGGDFYDIIPLDGRVLLVLADVSGHGLDGAMIATFVKSSIVNWLGANEGQDIALAALMQFVARMFVNTGYPDDYFACLFLGLIDAHRGVLEYVSTGFQTQLLIGQNEQVSRLPLGGLPISCSVPLEMLEAQVQRVDLPPHWTLFVTTDGLTEACHRGVYYESRAYQRFGDIMSLSAREIIGHLESDLDEFLQDTEISDDVTFLVVRGSG